MKDFLAEHKGVLTFLSASIVLFSFILKEGVQEKTKSVSSAISQSSFEGDVMGMLNVIDTELWILREAQKAKGLADEKTAREWARVQAKVAQQRAEYVFRIGQRQRGSLAEQPEGLCCKLLVWTE